MDDEKVTELFKEFGYEGTGLFHAILEKLAKQEKPIKTSVLKYQLKVGKKLEKCWSFMESLGIISSNNGDTFNKQLLNYAEKYQIKKEKTAKKVAEWRKNQEDNENVTSYETPCNPPKGKESKVKESKVIKEYKEKVADNVNLTHNELQSLLSEFGDEITNLSIEKLNAYKGSTGKKYKSDFLAIKSWVLNQVIIDKKNRNGTNNRTGKQPAASFAEIDRAVDLAFGNIPVSEPAYGNT
jgi:hypothetical protein